MSSLVFPTRNIQICSASFPYNFFIILFYTFGPILEFSYKNYTGTIYTFWKDDIFTKWQDNVIKKNRTKEEHFFLLLFYIICNKK